MMLDANTGLILGACGLGIVCFGLVAGMLFVVLRLTGRGYMEFLSIFVPQKEDKDEPNYIARRRPDLRHIAQGADFEAAIAKNVVQDDLRPTTGTPPPINSGFPAQSTPPSFSSGTPVPFGQPLSPPQPPTFTPPSFNDQPPADAGLPPAMPRLRNVDPLNRPRSNRTRDGYSDDEVFGGILDDDGDGQIDDYQ
jgi:hypothetical protein